MRLMPGGIDVFYIDESGDSDVYAITALAIPFLRRTALVWRIAWPGNFDAVKDWRKYIKNTHGIPMRKELHGHKFASGRGHYRLGKQQFSQKAAAAVYRDLLSRLSFLPDASIISVVGTNNSQLYGQTKLEAMLYALLQRMRTACVKARRNGLVFFDEGHGEYRKLYRRSLHYLPTGSMYGGWPGATINLPLDNFTKDGNEKDSKHSYYIQLADMIAYALFLKIKGERGGLTPWQGVNHLETLYDQIPISKLNLKASTKDPQGIVRL